MVLDTIQHLYNDYKSAREYSLDYTLDFFSKNEIQFNNIEIFEDKDSIPLYTELTWQYLHALYQKGRYNNTVDISTRNLKIIDKAIEHQNPALLKNDWYYGILFFKGMASYQLQDYKASTIIFRNLKEVDSQNENYEKWLNYSIYGKRLKISKLAAIVFAAMFLIDIFFKKFITSFILGTTLVVIALVGLIGTLVYDYYLKRSLRRNR